MAWRTVNELRRLVWWMDITQCMLSLLEFNRPSGSTIFDINGLNFTVLCVLPSPSSGILDPLLAVPGGSKRENFWPLKFHRLTLREINLPINTRSVIFMSDPIYLSWKFNIHVAMDGAMICPSGKGRSDPRLGEATGCRGDVNREGAWKINLALFRRRAYFT